MPDTTERPPIERDDGLVDVAPAMSYTTVIDPNEAVVYRGEEIGGYHSSFIVMSDDEAFGAWDVDTAYNLDNNHRFNKQRGLAVNRSTNREWLEYLCEPAPGENTPLTELGDN